MTTTFDDRLGPPLESLDLSLNPPLDPPSELPPQQLNILYDAYRRATGAAKRDAESALFQEIVVFAEKVVGKQSNKKAWTFSNNLTQKATDNSTTDIGQESALKVWRALSSFKHQCKFSTWVYRVCANVITDTIKTRVRHPDVAFWDWKGYGDPAPAWHGSATGTPPDGGTGHYDRPSWASGGDPKASTDNYDADSTAESGSGAQMSQQMRQQSEQLMIDWLDPPDAGSRPLILDILDRLSEDEREIVELVARGARASTIANCLDKPVRWVTNKLMKIRRLARKRKNISKNPKSVV